MDERDYQRALYARATKMRREPTEPEKRLWRAISGSKAGFKFRRQKVIGNRICDFFCPAKNAAIEVDGETHHQDSDAARDAYLASHGVSVIRVSNADVMSNIEGILCYLISQLNNMPDRWPHHPNPSSEEEGL